MSLVGTALDPELFSPAGANPPAGNRYEVLEQKFEVGAIDCRFVNRGDATAFLDSFSVLVKGVTVDRAPVLSYSYAVRGRSVVVSARNAGWGAARRARSATSGDGGRRSCPASSRRCGGRTTRSRRRTSGRCCPTTSAGTSASTSRTSPDHEVSHNSVPPSTVHAVVLDAEPGQRRDYALSRAIEPGGVERFHVALASVKSATYEIALGFRVDGREHIWSKPMPVRLERLHGSALPDNLTDGASFEVRDGRLVLGGRRTSPWW